ncbi:MAG: asparagine synthase-related protein [Alphaproteobacteria bacterium]
MTALAALVDVDGAESGPFVIGDMLRATMPNGQSLTRWRGGAAQLGLRMSQSATRLGSAGQHGDARHAIVADARLDNHGELAASLGLVSNTPVARLILAAHHAWGEFCVERLEGEFAFILWDAVSKSLFAARDRFGVKPLCYAQRLGRLAVGSAVQDVLAAPGIGRSLNERRIGDFIAGFLDDETSTFYDAVQRLPPAHALVFANGTLRLRRYWRLTPAEPDRTHAAEQFAALFQTAVRRRLPASGAGAMLSGGLDSSSVAATAQSASAAPLPTFTLTFGHGDERNYAEALLADGRYSPHFIDAADIAPFANFDALLAFQDGPFNAPNLAVRGLVHGEAKAGGVDVLLDGHGGDEVVSYGKGLFRDLASRGAVIALWRELHASRALLGDPNRLLVRLLGAYFPPAAALRAAMGKSTNASNARPLGHALLSPDLAARTRVSERFDEMHQALARADASESGRHLALMSSPLHSTAFEVLERVADADGVDARYPFYDEALVRLCVGLPASEKWRNGQARYVLREAMKPVLPPMIRTRTDKYDFGRQLAAGIMLHHKAMLDELFDDPDRSLCGYVDAKAARAAYQRLQPDAPYDGGNLQAVWRMVTLSCWLSRERKTVTARGHRAA